MRLTQREIEDFKKLCYNGVKVDYVYQGKVGTGCTYSN
jgi:hypothetical protein